MFRFSRFTQAKIISIAILTVMFGAGTFSAAAVKDDAAKADKPKPGEPTDPKARKTFASAVDWERHRNIQSAESDYRKANKQDGGHCWECLIRAYTLARSIGADKDEEGIAREMISQAVTDGDKADAHYWLALALQGRGISDKKDKFFSDSCDELKAVLAIESRFSVAHFSYGVSLAYLHQDEAARAEFAAFLDKDKQNPGLHERAARYKERVELARAKMAPPFSLTTLGGQRISMDGLAGKVVLIDFWATWCGPCREALPHIRSISKKFDGQPLVVLSISLDSDEAKWKDFVAKNGMTWLQYRDGSFDGNIAKQFSVRAIPATFTIDADGVLEDQHVGDADIERKLKKLVVRATEVANSKGVSTGAQDSTGRVNDSSVVK